MPVGRRQIAEENKRLREKLEECQVLLSALALESDGEFTIPADAFVKFSLAIDNEHAFVIERMDTGAIRVRFTPTRQDNVAAVAEEVARRRAGMLHRLAEHDRTGEAVSVE